MERGIDDYFAEHNEIRLDGDARSAAYLMIDRPWRLKAHLWHVRQIFLDEEDDGDFRIEADVDLDATQEQGEVIFRYRRVGFVGRLGGVEASPDSARSSDGNNGSPGRGLPRGRFGCADARAPYHLAGDVHDGVAGMGDGTAVGVADEQLRGSCRVMLPEQLPTAYRPSMGLRSVFSTRMLIDAQAVRRAWPPKNAPVRGLRAADHGRLAGPSSTPLAASTRCSLHRGRKPRRVNAQLLRQLLDGIGLLHDAGLHGRRSSYRRPGTTAPRRRHAGRIHRIRTY